MGVRGLLCRMGLAVGMEQCAYGKWGNGKREGSVAGAVAAGAGVVLDSIPQSEADETRNKARAVLRAIATAHHAQETF